MGQNVCLVLLCICSISITFHCCIAQTIHLGLNHLPGSPGASFSNSKTTTKESLVHIPERAVHKNTNAPDQLVYRARPYSEHEAQVGSSRGYLLTNQIQ